MSHRLLAIVIAAAILLIAATASATTATVCGSGCTFTTIFNAMGAGPDTILVMANAGISTSGGIVWNPAVKVLRGSSQWTINETYGPGNTRAFQITDCGEVRIENLKFTNFLAKSNTAGSGNYGGFAIVSSTTSGYDSLYVTDCWFDNCDAGATDVTGDTGRGGAFYIGASSGRVHSWFTNVKFTRCDVTYENASDCGGGAIYGYYPVGDLRCTGCTFGTAGNGNSVVGSVAGANCMGGAIRADSAPLYLTDCTFTDNSAQCAGAVLFWRFSVVYASLTGCTFTNNSATKWAGAAHYEHYAPEISDCAFVGNHADSLAGAFSSDDHTTFTDCEFLGNSTDSLAAAVLLGGCWLASPPTPSGGLTTFTRCIFQDNDATKAGGAILIPGKGVPGTAASLAIVDCLFADNDAHDGGDIFWYENGGGQDTEITMTRTIVAHSTGASIATDASDLDQFAGTFSCVDTFDVADVFIEHGPVTCSNCIDADPDWCTWTDDDTANDDFQLQGTSPCFALGPPCGHMGPHSWCGSACADCWAPPRQRGMQVRHYLFGSNRWRR